MTVIEKAAPPADSPGASRVVYVTTKEYAAQFGVSYQTIWRALRDRTIPGAVKLRGTWRIPADAVPGSAARS